MYLRKLLKSSATLYHRTGEDSDGNAEYARYRMKNVRLEIRSAVYASKNGMKPYDGFRLYVGGESTVGSDSVTETEYVSSISWDALTAAEKTEKWTAAEGDYVAEGLRGEYLGRSLSADEARESFELFSVNSVIPCRGGGRISLVEITGRGRGLDIE